MTYYLFAVGQHFSGHMVFPFGPLIAFTYFRIKASEIIVGRLQLSNKTRALTAMPLLENFTTADSSSTNFFHQHENMTKLTFHLFANYHYYHPSSNFYSAEREF